MSGAREQFWAEDTEASCLLIQNGHKDPSWKENLSAFKSA